MANVWQFSTSSLSLLESCVKAAAASNKPSEKWMKLFKPTEMKKEVEKHELNSMSTIEYGSDNDSVATEIMDTENRQDTTEKKEMDIQLAERMRGILEIDPSNKIEFLKENCDDFLLPFLAEKLTLPCIQKICNHIFKCRDGSPFVENFFQLFLPVYLKRECPLDLLVQAYKTYPDQFRMLMDVLLSDVDMPTKILEQFFLTVSENERSEFLQQLTKTELRSEAFIHHLSTISCLYKSSVKSFDIQNFILDCLQDCSLVCTEDKNYGKFMLTFFQSLKGSDYPLNKSLLEKLLNSHETSFKIPCIKIMSSL